MCGAPIKGKCEWRRERKRDAAVDCAMRNKCTEHAPEAGERGEEGKEKKWRAGGSKTEY
jgi:hypothetical protein